MFIYVQNKSHGGCLRGRFSGSTYFLKYFNYNRSGVIRRDVQTDRQTDRHTDVRNYLLNWFGFVLDFQTVSIFKIFLAFNNV